MSNCNKYSELISAYADGEATNEEKALVQKHIAECEDCKKKLDFILKTKEILKDTQPVPVPETLLADFAEFKKKSEEREKKIVPFYKSYRMYASIAAVFVFAFVLKSGLWQEGRYLPNQTEQYSGVQQELTASEQKVDAVIEETPKIVSDVEVSGNTKKQADVQNQTVKKVVPAEEKMTNRVNQPAKDILPETAPVQEQSTTTEASVTDQSDSFAAYSEDADVPASGGGGGSSAAAYSRMADEAEPAEDTMTEKQEVINAQIYVSEQNFEKAKQLLSDEEYFFHQVEQKLNDNFIPFESNFLLLDESIPHKIEVLVKSE